MRKSIITIALTILALVTISLIAGYRCGFASRRYAPDVWDDDWLDDYLDEEEGL